MTARKKDASTAPWEDAPTDSETNVAVYDDFSQFSPSESVDEDVADDELVTPEKETLIDQIASEFVGFWNVLVSKTNWEKGKVIHSWRMKLIEAGTPRRVYSDDAIAQRIGNVTPQHVGRLRRVYERFGEREPLPNLYWSHYQAALDWDDADAWLQQASDEKISVAQMRFARWEKTGAKPKLKPKDDDIVVAERDEDVNPYNDSDADLTGVSTPIGPGRSDMFDSTVDDEEEKKPKKKKDARSRQESELGEFAGDVEPWEGNAEPIRTPEVLDAIGKLDELPVDLMEALESLKLAIISHKLAGWDDVKPIQIAAYLSEFKRLLVSEEK
ncbi:MAG: hypothetical protein IKX88_03730 [Thermoguttaceae bacterium]|nr:hypothetical protein [Thermoguttaceae bacterium]